MPPIFWKIVLGVALGFVIIRGGGPALIRLLLPVVLVYFGYKAIQRLAATKLAELSERMREAQRQAQQRGRGDYEAWPGGPGQNNQGPTIEICPGCGFQKSPKNMCTCA